MTIKQYTDKKNGTYIFGSILLIFFIYIFLFSPDTLPLYKQRMMAFASSLLAGLFTFFLSGSIKLIGKLPNTRFGEIGIQAGSGIAVFVLVLIWWLSSSPPIEVKKIDEKLSAIDEKLSDIRMEDITARVTFYISHADENTPEIFKNKSELELRIVENDNLDFNDIKGWKNGFFIPDSSLVIISTTQLFDRKNIQSIDMNSVELIRDYKDFKGKLKGLKDNKKWKHSSFEGIIRVVEKNKWLDNFKKEYDSLDLDLRITFDDFLEKYKVSQRQKNEMTEYDYRVTVYPIIAKLEIFNNGLYVGSSEGIVVKVREWDEDVRDLFIVKFPVTKLNL